MAEGLLARLGAWGAEVLRVARGNGDDDGAVRRVDDALETEIQSATGLDGTIRKAAIEARRGQGRFRLNVEAVEQACCVTGVTDPRLLRASHIKPWRSCGYCRRLIGNLVLGMPPVSFGGE
jgi:putative restriction endonuclease